MAQTLYDRYLTDEVLSADPVKLVWLLYRGGIEAVQAARRSIDERDIRARVGHINRAWGILQELAGCLNHSEGGDISRRLAALYSYMQTRLLEANAQQSAGPLDEVENLLLTLVDAWRPAAHATPRELEPAIAYNDAAYDDAAYDPDCEAELVSAVG